jgi:putative NADH-flavin reductase
MNVVIFGSTGRTGRRLVTGALARGHVVTAVARSPKKVTVTHERLRVLRADVLDYAAVDLALAGQEAVLIALGADSLRRPTAALTQGVQHIIMAMKKHGVRRLICISAAGVGLQPDPNLTFFFRYIFRPLFLRNILPELRHMEVNVRQSGLDWTLVRPPWITWGDATGRYRVEPGYTLPNGKRIARADLADFMLKQLDGAEHVGHAVAIAY